ncbi:hypothetical protein C0J52_15161, partial [Blattella germanica]
VRIWGLQNPHEHIEHVRDSTKVNVFCAISHSSVYDPFFFHGDTVNGQQYLAMLQNRLFPRLHEENFIWQQDGHPLTGVAMCVSILMKLYRTVGLAVKDLVT